MKILEKLLDEKSDVSLSFFWQIIGPLFVLCTFALAPHDPLVFCVGALGLFFSAKYQMKGFIASLFFLGLVAIGQHGVLKERHLWFFGLELSYAVAFFITAMNAGQYHSFIESFFSQIETKNSSISNLEDEFTKSRSDATKQQVFLQEKIDALQKQVEETLSEHASLLILNEVLRKTSSRHLAENSLVREELLDAQSSIYFRQLEKEEMERELCRLRNERAVVLENRELAEELNQIRVDREQTHMINETLARLHAKESLKAQSVLDQFSSIHLEKQKVDAQLEEMKSQLIRAIEERDQYQTSMQSMYAAQDALKEQLKEVECKPSIDLSQYVPKETVDALEKKMNDFIKVELLYKQLKTQFAEKNEVLHKTRSELFHKDNSLQALQIELEKSQITANEVPPKIIHELSQLESEVANLSQENEELQNLVTVLSNPASLEPFKRKKKVKLNPDQEYLF